MLLSHLVGAIWPIFIGGVVLVLVSVLFGTVLTPGFGVLKDHPWPRRLIAVAPFAYPLLCWGLFSWAASHDRRVEEALRANGTAASATVTAVRDLGIDVNVNPLLMLELRVTPPGAAPFDAELAVNPSRLVMHTFQPGVTLRVRYDPRDRSRLALDE